MSVYNLRRAARKSWEAILGLRYFRLQKVKEGGGSTVADFVHLAAQAKKKAAHGHVAYAVQEVPFWASFDAVFDTSCPGNEGCAVVPDGLQ
jgi:hypothetical protein